MGVRRSLVIHARDSGRRVASRLGLATSEEVSALRREVGALYRQAEKLPLLYSSLAPSLPLPPTRGWAVSPDALVGLMLDVLARKPRNIVEFGSGTSSVVLGLAARKVGVGRVHSYDHDPEYAQLTRDRLVEHGLDDLVTVSTCPIGPLGDDQMTFAGGPGVWYSGVELPEEIDLVFVDGPVGDMARCVRYPALAAVAPRLSPGARILLDDADRPDEVELVERWLSRWPELSSVPSPEAEKGLATLAWRS